MTSRAGRKRAELRAKLDGLTSEFAAWRAMTQSGALPRHHSQVEAIVRALQTTLEPVAGAADADDAALLATWAQTEEDLLAVHEIWDYFREKFALRHVAEFEPYLRMADDFAYACYRPAQQRGVGNAVAADEVRAPPLVFLSRVATPYALARGASYAAEVHPAALTADEFRAAVDTLPIPVIGVPWFQLRHLPDALVIGHEVGHHVAHDLRLDDTVVVLVEGALGRAQVPPDRRAAWSGWLPEVFADVYGVLAAGPAYVGALADFVPTGPQAAIGSAGYPPAGVRIRLAAAASLATKPGAADGGAPPGPAESGGRPDVEAEVLDRWRTDFADEGASPFQADVPVVVSALLDGPYPQFGGVGLAEVLAFDDRRARAMTHVDALLGGGPLDAGIDVRVLLAAAAIAFGRDPAGYETDKVHDRVLAHAAKIEAKGLRASAPTGTSAPHDRAAGAAVAALLANRRQ